jgi:hypothetical protein
MSTTETTQEDGRVPVVGVAMIRAERLRQVAVEGYDEEHDAHHGDGDLIRAAVAYAIAAVGAAEEHTVRWWPWDRASFKPGPEPLDSLVKAGALIAAELDRIIADVAYAEKVRREAAEAKLAEVRSVLLEGGQDNGTARRRALAIHQSRPSCCRSASTGTEKPPGTTRPA